MLTSVKIPKSVEEIGQGAFAGADRIKYFEGKGASEDGQFLIWGNRLVSFALDSEWLKHDEIKVPEGIEEIGDWAITFNKLDRHWRYIHTLPNSVKRIGTCSLSGCGMNSKLSIPDSVEEIGDGAFSDDMIITGKFVDENGNVICNETLIFQNGLGERSDRYGSERIEHTEFIVPQGVKRIGSFANIYAGKMVIPEGVESIGEKAIRVSKHISLPSTLKRIDGDGIQSRELCEEISFPEGLISIGNTLEEIRSYSVSFKSNPPACQGYNPNALIIVPEEKFELYKDAYSGVVKGFFFYGGIAFRDEKGELHFEKLTPEEAAKKDEEMNSFWSEFEDLAPSNEAFDTLLEKYAHGVIKENGESFYFIDILPESLRIELRFNRNQRLCACTLHELQKAEKYDQIHYYAFNQATGFKSGKTYISDLEEDTCSLVSFKTPSGLRNNGIAWKLPAGMDSVGAYALFYTAAVIQAGKMLPLLNSKDE